MKAIYRLSLILIALVFDCSSEQESEKNVKPDPVNYVLIVDKSASIDNIDYQPIITKTLSDRLNSGDMVYLSFIYENSGSALNQHSFHFVNPGVPNDGFLDKDMQELQRRKNEKKAKESFLEKISKTISQPKADRRQTAILDVLIHLEGLQNSVVFFLSDMLEQSPKRFMKANNGEILIDSRDKAIEVANYDYKRLTTDPCEARKFLKSVKELIVIAPNSEAMSGLEYEFIPLYWEVMFDSLGFKGEVDFLSVFDVMN